MDDLAKRLLDLEHEVDELVQRSTTTAPQGTRTILRSISNLFMAARWLVEDQRRATAGEAKLPAYATGDHE